jgi:hypothetical protein
MANTKISALPVATTPVLGTALIPVVQSGATKVTTAAEIRNSPEPFTIAAQATGSVTASDPNTLKMYSRSYGGRVMPEYVGNAGMNCFFQPALFNNNFMLWQPSTTTVGGTIQGNTFTSAGTVSTPALASTNYQTSMRRTMWASTTANGNTAGIRGGATQVWRGNAANLGGFFAFFRFSQAASTQGHQCFVGLCSSLVALSSDPSLLPTMIGIGYDATDTVANGWQVMRNDASGSATKVALGAAAPRDTTTVLDLTVYCPPNSSSMTVRVYNQSAQTVALENAAYTTDLPDSTAFLTYHCQARTGTTGVAVNPVLNRIYIESDI